MSEHTQCEAIKARLTSALSSDGSKPALDVAQIKTKKAAGALPAYYVEVQVERRYSAEGRRGDGTSDLTYYRASTRVVGTDHFNTGRMQDRVREELEDKSITDGGRESTGFEFVAGNPVADDDGRYSALTDWHYVL